MGDYKQSQDCGNNAKQDGENPSPIQLMSVRGLAQDMGRGILVCIYIVAV